jgi:hypothetical protein
MKLLFETILVLFFFEVLSSVLGGITIELGDLFYFYFLIGYLVANISSRRETKSLELLFFISLISP